MGHETLESVSVFGERKTGVWLVYEIKNKLEAKRLKGLILSDDFKH